jgi:hypothetical protein
MCLVGQERGVVNVQLCNSNTVAHTAGITQECTNLPVRERLTAGQVTLDAKNVQRPRPLSSPFKEPEDVQPLLIRRRRVILNTKFIVRQ